MADEIPVPLDDTIVVRDALLAIAPMTEVHGDDGGLGRE